MIKRIVIMLTLAITAAGFAGVAAAQNGDTAARPQQARELIQQYRQKAAKLQRIRAETLNANPELREQHKAFVAMVREAIEDQGYDIEAGRQRVQSMAAKLRSGDLSEAERKAVIQDFTAERRALGKARAAALQQPEVRAAGRQLQQQTLAAMKAHNPNVDNLIQDMKRLRRQIRAIMQQAPAN